MKTIFVVDDNDTNLVAAKTALDGTYRTFTISNAARLFKLAEKIRPDLILLDVEMPEMDGFTAMEKMKTDPNLSPILSNVPVIFLTAVSDSSAELRGFELGAVDFISKPFSTPILLKRIESHIETDKVIKNSQKSLRNIQNAMISVIADLVENRDKVTGGHIERTQQYLKILIDELIRTGTYAEQISKWDLNLLIPSAQLHDVGKITITDLILNKPAKLTDEEFDQIKNHASEGERIIDTIIGKTSDDGFLNHAKMFAGYHHEKWDGSGYPHGLAGEDIPLEGRIMAIADVYDALVSERPYKKAFTHEKATQIILAESGTHFDPKLTDAFKNIADDFWIESMVVN
ncbi:MAG: response regulator [Oscillospiraceae bacterium]|nr:response regulator [Oscillospiraceae bacterium]